MEKTIYVYWVISLLLWLRNIYFTKYEWDNSSSLKPGTILIKPPVISRVLAGIPTLKKNFGNGVTILNVFWGQYFALLLAICAPIFITKANNVTFLLHQAILAIAFSISCLPTYIVYKTCFYKKI